MARSGASARSAPRSGDGVRFALNEEIVRADVVWPQTSLLAFLREQFGCTRTEKGCAAGDCSTCTAALAEPIGENGPNWRPITGRIRRLPAIVGNALVTVENLKSRTGALHPVQQALVE
jgi:xanthine dehydrogenase small subunit